MRTYYSASLSNVKGNQELVELNFLRRLKEISRVYSLYLRGAAFSTFGEQVQRIV